MKAFGAEEKDRSCKIHARPAMFTKTIFDIGVNMLRETTQIFSAVVGGVDSYENDPYDATVRKGDEFSRVSQETYTSYCRKNLACFVRSIRPAVLGIEALTKKWLKKSGENSQKIESLGGILKALKEEYPRQQDS